MSTHVSSDVRKYSQSRGNDRLVLIEIADQATHEGWAVLYAATIAENTLIAVRTVFDCLGRLEAAGELERRSGKARGRSNVFRVLVAKEPRLSGEPVPGELVEKFRLPGGYADSADPPSADSADPGYADSCTPGMQPAADSKRVFPSSPRKTREQSSLAAPNAAAGPSRSEVKAMVVREPDQIRALMTRSGWLESSDAEWLFTRDGQRRDWLFEAVGEVVGLSTKDLTKNGRGRVNGALKQLRDVGADPLEVLRRGRRFVKQPHRGGRRPSIFELATLWAELGDAADDRFAGGDARHADAVARAARVVSG